MVERSRSPIFIARFAVHGCQCTGVGCRLPPELRESEQSGALVPNLDASRMVSHLVSRIWQRFVPAPVGGAAASATGAPTAFSQLGGPHHRGRWQSYRVIIAFASGSYNARMKVPITLGQSITVAG
jgi:hypothetical protein